MIVFKKYIKYQEKHFKNNNESNVDWPVTKYVNDKILKNKLNNIHAHKA